MQVFITNRTLVADLCAAGYRCIPKYDTDEPVYWYETDCPLKRGEPFTLPSGNVLIYAGTCLKTYEEDRLYTKQLLEAWERGIPFELPFPLLPHERPVYDAPSVSYDLLF